MAIMGKSQKSGVDAPSSPPESGWPALHRTVRDADVTKVDDCREDIDTLLVFAGLYSAVLTAFVVESYTHLQQDPQDVIIGLLEQIATQRFVTGPGFINSTITSTPPPPFEPPLWAIRVNILWFASLLLSLSSASFGILVKQWLREYLAIEHSSPRERLRARQYRTPALAQWKVFEIAAFLPLLLQLSLGLFFLGLCFFTAAVHNSIGRTTTPLVCAWAFLFFVTTIAPLFSPRCPFKTTFLKSTLRAGRCYIIPLLTRPFRLCLACLSRSIARFIAVWNELIDLSDDKLDDVLNALHRTSRSIPWEWVQLLFRVMCYITLSPVLVPVLVLGKPGSYLRRRLPQFKRPKLRQFVRRVGQPLLDFWKRTTQDAVSLEEEEVIRTEEEDSGVLLSVDSLVSDDGLLPTMLDALRQQVGASSEKIVQFISQIILQRIGRESDVPRLTFVPDLRLLSKFAWSTLTDTLADILQQGLLDSNSLDHAFNALVILLAPSQFGLSERATQALLGALVAPSWKPDGMCSDGVHFNQCLAQARVDPTNTLLNSSTPACVRCTVNVYKALLCQNVTCSHPSLCHLLDTHAPEDLFVASSNGLLQDLINILIPLLRTISLQKDPAEIPGSHEALHIILQYGEKFGRRDDAVKLCHQMLLTESGIRMLLVQFTALHPQCRVSEDIRGILWAAPTSWEDAIRIRSHLTAACERFCNGSDDGADDVPLDYVRLCAAFIWWRGDGQTDRAVAKAIEKYYRTQGWQKTLQRREYWYSNAESPTSEELFKADQDLACEVLENWRIRSTELINALWAFVPEERSDEILRSIREFINYTPPTLPAPSTALEESENGQGGTAKGGQEAGDAGSEGPVGMGQDAGRGEAVNVEASGSADVSTIEVPSGAERTEEHDASEREAVDGGDV